MTKKINFILQNNLSKKIIGILISLVILIIILLVSVVLIAFGRGYRFDTNSTDLKSTGLVSATSDPVGAQVYVDGNLKTATNNTFNIDPNWYTVKITKEGYIPWEKKLRIQGEVVTRADAFLFPKTPSLSPITTTGIVNPSLSPDGTKIAYVITGGENTDPKKIGLWVYELVDHPLGFNRDTRLLDNTSTAFDFTRATFRWSTDSTQILAQNGIVRRLYNTNGNGSSQDVTGTYELILKQWDEDLEIKNKSRLSAFKQPVINTFESKVKIISFSPDETKLLYEATESATIPLGIDPPLIGTNPTNEIRDIRKGDLYVYDSREDKNYLILSSDELLNILPTPTATKLHAKPTPTPKSLNNVNIYNSHYPVLWFPTSRHLILTQNGKLDIMEYDRTNWTTVYAGPFVDGFVAPWPSTSRLIVLADFNPGEETLPNLYTINLR